VAPTIKDSKLENKNNPLVRLNQLRTGDPTLDFQVAYFIPSSLGWSLSQLESHIHEELEQGFCRSIFIMTNGLNGFRVIRDMHGMS
jgi:hypothetical protein